MHERRLYAHRGASAERPENTMISFARAVELGVHALELDVHATRDGEIIVHHDDTAARMAGAPLAWSALDYADARALDVGWGFVAPDGTRPFAGRGVSVARFEEVVTTFSSIYLNVDVKDPRAAAGAVDIIKRAGAEERVTIASFQLATLVKIRRGGYGGQTALAQSEVASLAALPALLWRQLPFTGTAAQVPVNAGPIRFDRPAFIAKCHNLGLRVDFWTIDDRAEAERLLALGADGIMTNDPVALMPLFP
jgi:glycerophosphoryl diester phosphodiesterase